MEPPLAQSNDPPWSSEWLEESTDEGEKHTTILLAILEILKAPRLKQPSFICKGVPFLIMSCFPGCTKINLGFPITGSNFDPYYGCKRHSPERGPVLDRISAATTGMCIVLRDARRGHAQVSSYLVTWRLHSVATSSHPGELYDTPQRWCLFSLTHACDEWTLATPWGKKLPLVRAHLCVPNITGASRGAEPSCRTVSPTALLLCLFLDGDEMNNQHCMSHALNRPRRITTDAVAISQTTSVICAHSPVFLTGNVLMLSPDCWPSEGICAFIVTESKWIPRKFTCCRGWRLCCSSSLQWNQGI